MIRLVFIILFSIFSGQALSLGSMNLDTSVQYKLTSTVTEVSEHEYDANINILDCCNNSLLKTKSSVVDNGVSLAFVSGFLAAKSGKVFWSGPGSRAAAETFAKANGAKTLEMTATGKVLDKITTPGNFKYVKPLWNAASKRFAKGAKGQVDVFHSGKGVRVDSVWAKKEYPILKNQGNGINYHVVE